MTTPSKLDEARLRELAEAAKALEPKKSGALNMRWWNAKEAFQDVANPATILALLDALSAERERGDRAVGLLREASFTALESPHSDDLDFRITVFLATQKAES